MNYLQGYHSFYMKYVSPEHNNDVLKRMVGRGKFCIDVAAEHNDLDSIKWMYANGYRRYEDILNIAIEEGYNDIIDWCNKNNISANYDRIVCAINTEKWKIYHKLHLYETYMFEHAAKYGNKALMKLLIDKSEDHCEFDIKYAAKYEHFDICEYFLELGGTYNMDVIPMFAMHGKFPNEKYFSYRNSVDVTSVLYAVAYGHIQLAKDMTNYMNKNNVSFYYDSHRPKREVERKIGRNASLDEIKWLSSICKKLYFVCIEAAKHKKYDVVEHLLINGRLKAKRFHKNAIIEHLMDNVEFIIKHRKYLHITKNQMRQIIHKYDFSIVKQLCDSETLRWSHQTNMIYEYIKMNKMDAVKWIIETYDHNLSLNLITNIIKMGDINIITHILDNYYTFNKRIYCPISTNSHIKNYLDRNYNFVYTTYDA